MVLFIRKWLFTLSAVWYEHAIEVFEVFQKRIKRVVEIFSSLQDLALTQILVRLSSLGSFLVRVIVSIYRHLSSFSCL